MKLHPIKVPLIKYQEAKKYQINLQNRSGLNLPLWACMIENEKINTQQKQLNDVNKLFRRRLI